MESHQKILIAILIAFKKIMSAFLAHDTYREEFQIGRDGAFGQKI